MKRIVILVTMSLFIVGSCFAGFDPILTKEIRQKVKIDLSTITLGKYDLDFVEVQFKIYDGIIQIEKIEASQLELMELVIKELREIHIRTPYSESDIYKYNFTFEKK